MFKDQILKNGIQKAPEELEIEILLYAAENMTGDEPETNFSDYLNWLPFAGTVYLLKDLFAGKKIKISPAIGL